ncbi:MAG: MerR family transcriptional regulator [Chloroflexi bacterium]|nr:MAG: MerR family transcriptional regulator [Chloroflexota bacterium]
MMTNVEPIDNATARFQIGEVADRTGVTQRALRFYEERGLLRPPERMEGGFRLYSENDVSRIAYIRQLQNLLGFTLSEIKDMVEAEELLLQISNTRRPDRQLPERLARTDQILFALKKQLDVVEHKVEHLAVLREELRGKLGHTSQRHEEILAAIAQERSLYLPPISR